MDKFTFGKYKGYDVDTVIEINPSYVLWAHNNVSYFSLTNEQYDKCISAIQSKYHYKHEVIERTWSDDYDDENGYSPDFENDMRACFDPNY